MSFKPKQPWQIAQSETGVYLVDSSGSPVIEVSGMEEDHILRIVHAVNSTLKYSLSALESAVPTQLLQAAEQLETMPEEAHTELSRLARQATQY